MSFHSRWYRAATDTKGQMWLEERIGQIFLRLSLHSDIEMWNFLVDRTRHGVKCDYSEHCGRAAAAWWERGPVATGRPRLLRARTCRSAPPTSRRSLALHPCALLRTSERCNPKDFTPNIANQHTTTHVLLKLLCLERCYVSWDVSIQWMFFLLN